MKRRTGHARAESEGTAGPIGAAESTGTAGTGDGRFPAVFDATLDAMAIWEAVRGADGAIEDFVLAFANRQWRELNTPETADPRGIHMYRTFPDDLARRKVHAHVVETGEPVTLSAAIGSTWREMALTRFGDGFIAASRDVTTRVLAEEALRESEQRWLFALEGAGHGVWDWRVDTDEVSFSPRWKAMLGFGPDELEDTHQAWTERIHPDDREATLAAMQDHLDGRTALYEHEYRLQHRDGSWRNIVARGRVASRAPDGSPLRVVGTHTDVTGRRRVEAELGEAQRLEAVGRLAGDVAHEFNNILAAINGWAEILAGETPADDPRAAEIAAIREAGARAAALTRQLLAVGRRLMLHASLLSIEEVIDELRPVVGAAAGPGVSVSFATPVHDAWIRADRTQLRLVAIELASNAVDAMPHGGSLSVETSLVTPDATEAARRAVAPGTYVRIAFADTGVGIDAAAVSRVFEPFFTTKPFGRAKGLGLATVEGIVSQSGGWVTCDSERGCGTTVAIHFPRVRADDEGADAEGADAESADAEGADAGPGA